MEDSTCLDCTQMLEMMILVGCPMEALCMGLCSAMRKTGQTQLPQKLTLPR